MGTLRITGGRVLRPNGTIESSDVLIDQDTGDIVDVGEIGGGDETLDASGGLLIPGLINAHTHISMTLLRGHADDKPLESWLEEDIWPVEEHLTGEDVQAGAELGMLEMIKSGTTAFADMYFFMSQVAKAVRKAGLRAVLGHGIITDEKDDNAARSEIRTGVEFATEYKGAADGRIHTALTPHGLYSVDEEYLIELREQAQETGLPLHFHANETKDEVSDVFELYERRPIEAADDLGLLETSTFVAHGVHLNETEINLLEKSGAGVAHCPASNMKLASGMAAVQQLLDSGVTVGLGTDGAASNNDLDMFDELRDAAMVGKLAANDATAVDASTAVELATVGSADLLGLNSGRIERDANADLIVVDFEKPHLTPNHNPLSHLAYAARGSDVRHTICDGQVLMHNREVLVFDEEAVRARAEEQAYDLLDRAGKR